MKVLVLTPLYYIKGRENLSRNTSAIHYLLKYWPETTEVMVIHEYHAYAKRLLRYASREEREYLKNGYHFEEDGISVNMVELPLLPKQYNLFKFQKNYMVSRINLVLEQHNFIPDIIICHQPTCCVGQYISEIDYGVRKIAVLHITDQQYCERNKTYIDLLNDQFDALYCRSMGLYGYFSKTGVSNLRKQIVDSGVPAYEAAIRKNWDGNTLNIVYAGKLTKRKHVDDIIKALSEMSAKRSFHLYIIGEGPEKDYLNSLVDAYHMNEIVSFTGALSRENVYDSLGKCDIFAMPSTGETLGLVYLEAMRQACIPIGTQGEGIDGIIIDGENGFLVPPNNPEVLHNLFYRLLNVDDVDLKKISAAAKTTGDQYDEKEKSLTYYRMICDEVSIASKR